MSDPTQTSAHAHAQAVAAAPALRDSATSAAPTGATTAVPPSPENYDAEAQDTVAVAETPGDVDRPLVTPGGDVYRDAHQTPFGERSNPLGPPKRKDSMVGTLDPEGEWRERVSSQRKMQTRPAPQSRWSFLAFPSAMDATAKKWLPRR